MQTPGADPTTLEIGDAAHQLALQSFKRVAGLLGVKMQPEQPPTLGKAAEAHVNLLPLGFYPPAQS
jgi:hypothetical protein